MKIEVVPSKFKDYWSPSIRNLTPYQPGEQADTSNTIKLNTNENPYPPSPHVVDAIKELISETGQQLRLYPDPDANILRNAICQQYKLCIENVFIGNGSDEVLAFIFKAFFQHPHKKILFPDISYSFYPVYANLYEIEYKTVPVNENFEINIEDYNIENAGIIIANPNAPTGIALNLNQIKKILESNPNSVVVIDEAYVDFGAESAVKLIKEYENIVVCQTTSKSRSLAGLRVGYALAHPNLIQAINIVKNSFNSFPVDSLAAIAATASFQDTTYFQNICNKIILGRNYLVEQLELMGFFILPSEANFIFVRHPSHDAVQLALQLKKRNILVRHFNKARIDQFLRITIGTHENNLTLVKTLKEIMK